METLKKPRYRKVINMNKSNAGKGRHHTPKRKTEKEIKRRLILSMKNCGRAPKNAWKPGGPNPMRNPKIKAKQIERRSLTWKLRALERQDIYYRTSTIEMSDHGIKFNIPARA